MSMNYLIANNITDFKEIIESPIFIGCDKKLLDAEISTNMWAISFDNQIKDTSMDKLLEFINNLVDKKKQQVSELNISCTVIFYLWFDEMASQLRFNIISDSHNKLPFGCELNIINSPQSILAQFLQSQHSPEISWNELEENTEDFDDAEEYRFVLDVFVMQLNKKTAANI